MKIENKDCCHLGIAKEKSVFVYKFFYSVYRFWGNCKKILTLKNKIHRVYQHTNVHK